MSKLLTLRRLRRGGLFAWILVVMLGCMGCCCGGVPLFGLWPRLDPAPVEAALRGQPLVVDHTCRAEFVCAQVETAQVDLLPMSWSPFTGEITVLVDLEATCRAGERGEQDLGEVAACAGLVAAVFVAADEGWELVRVTEYTSGMESSGEPYEGGGGGDWDD